jgi:hypothetical protein
MRDTVATNTFEKVIEKMAGVIANNGALDQTALETLAIGAVANYRRSSTNIHYIFT